jgi:hypothetical protein
MTDFPMGPSSRASRGGMHGIWCAAGFQSIMMRIGGWKTRSVFDRYNTKSERDLVKAAAKLEGYFADAETERVRQFQSNFRTPKKKERP